VSSVDWNTYDPNQSHVNWNGTNWAVCSGSASSYCGLSYNASWLPLRYPDQEKLDSVRKIAEKYLDGFKTSSRAVLREKISPTNYGDQRDKIIGDLSLAVVGSRSFDPFRSQRILDHNSKIKRYQEEIETYYQRILYRLRVFNALKLQGVRDDQINVLIRTCLHREDKRLTAVQFDKKMEDLKERLPQNEEVFCLLDQLRRPFLEGQISEFFDFVEDMLSKQFKELQYRKVLRVERIEEIAKRLLERMDQNDSLRERLQQVVDKTSQFVETHKVLKDLRDFKQFLEKGGRDFSNPIMHRFRGFVSVQSASQLFQGEGLCLCKQLRQRIWNAAQEADSFLSTGKRITWITGSRSAAIPMIKRVIPDPALVPTGMMRRYNIAPLTGELSSGTRVYGVNRWCLSGMCLGGFEDCMRYATEPVFVFNPKKEVQGILNLKKKHAKSFEEIRERLGIGVLRLLLTGQEEEQWGKLQKHIQRKILNHVKDKKSSRKDDWERYAHLVGKEVSGENVGLELGKKEELVPGQLVSVLGQEKRKWEFGLVCAKERKDKYSVLMKRQYAGAVRFLPFREEVFKDSLRVPNEGVLREVFQDTSQTEGTEDFFFLALQEMMRTNQERAQEILDLFDQVKPMEFSQEDQSLINESFPLIWASYTAEPYCFRLGGIKGEQLLKGIAELGRDIQVVFTDPEHIPVLRRAVYQYGVNVLSFDAARYIMMCQ